MQIQQKETQVLKVTAKSKSRRFAQKQQPS